LNKKPPPQLYTRVKFQSVLTTQSEVFQPILPWFTETMKGFPFQFHSTTKHYHHLKSCGEPTTHPAK